MNGSEECPQQTDCDAYKKYCNRRDRALATIVLTLDPELLYLVENIDDPIQVWNKLEKNFQTKSVASKFALRKKLINTKFQDGISIQSHVKIFSETFSNLAAIGDTLENDDKVFYLLCSLPERFDMIVATIENSDSLPDFEVVVQKLMEQDAKQRERCEEIKSATKALASKINNEKRTCHHCHKPGHIAKNCWILHPDLKKGKPYKQMSANHSAKVSHNEETKKCEEDVGLVSEIYCLNNCSSADWIIDSGASCHMTNNKELLENCCKLENEVLIKVGDGRKLKSTIHGTVTIRVEINGTTKRLILSDVLYVPDLAFNLISVKKCTSKGLSAVFSSNKCVFMKQDESEVCEARAINGLYNLITHSEPNANVSLDMWHKRMGHICKERLQKMKRENMVEGFNIGNNAMTKICEPCISGKQTRSSFPSKDSDKSYEILELIHSDICGKLPEKSLSQSEYFITFLDEKSRYSWVFPLKKKSDALHTFQCFKVTVEKETGKSIKILRTDNGGEYCSTNFENFLIENGIKHETTVPRCPEQNGTTERLNRTLMESVKALLADSGLEK